MVKRSETRIYGGPLERCSLCRLAICDCDFCSRQSAKTPETMKFVRALLGKHCSLCPQKVAGECVGLPEVEPPRIKKRKTP